MGMTLGNDWSAAMAGKSGRSSGGGGRSTNSPRKGGPERRIVQPTADGYEVVKPHHERPSATAPTKAAAAKRAKEIVTNLGGGEVTLKDEKGRIGIRTRSAVATTRTHLATESTEGKPRGS